MACCSKDSSCRAMTSCSTVGTVAAAESHGAASWEIGEMLRRLSRLIARRRAVV